MEHSRLIGRVLEDGVLHHTKRGYNFNSFDALLARAAVHWRLLELFLDRSPPGLLAIGPAATSSEPKDYVEASRRVLRSAAMALDLPWIEYHTEEEIRTELRLRARLLPIVVAKSLHKRSKNRQLYLASSSGLAAASQMLDLRVDLDTLPELVEKPVTEKKKRK